jgi:hypothetical protein
MFSECIEILLRRRKSTAILVPELQSRRTRQRSFSSDNNASSNGNSSDFTPVQSVQSLATLNAQIKRAQARLVSNEQRWTSIMRENDMFSSLVEGNFSKPTFPTISSSTSSLKRIRNNFNFISEYIRYIWLIKLRNLVLHFLAVTTATLSVMVLLSEATMSLPYNLSPFALILRYFDNHELEKGILFEVLALIPLLYMSICVYRSLFKVRIFGIYCLRGYKQSPPVALVFNAQYLVRMQFSLGYNYLLMLKYDLSSTNCAFYKLMSHMQTIPFFGTSFSTYAPLMILALCVFTFYNIYPRILAFLGIEHEDALLLGDQDTLNSQINEGILLLRRQKGRNNLNNTISTSEEENEV